MEHEFNPATLQSRHVLRYNNSTFLRAAPPSAPPYHQQHDPGGVQRTPGAGQQTPGAGQWRGHPQTLHESAWETEEDESPKHPDVQRSRVRNESGTTVDTPYHRVQPQHGIPHYIQPHLQQKFHQLQRQIFTAQLLDSQLDADPPLVEYNTGEEDEEDQPRQTLPYHAGQSHNQRGQPDPIEILPYNGGQLIESHNQHGQPEPRQTLPYHNGQPHNPHSQPEQRETLPYYEGQLMEASHQPEPYNIPYEEPPMKPRYRLLNKQPTSIYNTYGDAKGVNRMYEQQPRQEPPRQEPPRQEPPRQNYGRYEQPTKQPYTKNQPPKTTRYDQQQPIYNVSGAPEPRFSPYEEPVREYYPNGQVNPSYRSYGEPKLNYNPGEDAYLKGEAALAKHFPLVHNVPRRFLRDEENPWRKPMNSEFDPMEHHQTPGAYTAKPALFKQPVGQYGGKFPVPLKPPAYSPNPNYLPLPHIGRQYELSTKNKRTSLIDQFPAEDYSTYSNPAAGGPVNLPVNHAGNHPGNHPYSDYNLHPSVWSQQAMSLTQPDMGLRRDTSQNLLHPEEYGSDWNEVMDPLAPPPHYEDHDKPARFYLPDTGSTYQHVINAFLNKLPGRSTSDNKKDREMQKQQNREAKQRLKSFSTDEDILAAIVKQLPKKKACKVSEKTRMRLDSTSDLDCNNDANRRSWKKNSLDGVTCAFDDICEEEKKEKKKQKFSLSRMKSFFRSHVINGKVCRLVVLLVVIILVALVTYVAVRAGRESAPEPTAEPEPESEPSTMSSPLTSTTSTP